MELILREKLQTRESSVLKLHRSKIYEAQTGWQNLGRCPQAEKKGFSDGLTSKYRDSYFHFLVRFGPF